MANRLKEDDKNERIIRNLLKLPENRRCINCNSLGPQYVCINFSSFVCTTCSGIHREFTHRVKSVSMAKFTPQEVSALQGGGNASAREIYLKEWDPQRNSLPDASNVERLRDFIKHIYVDRRYSGERNLEKPLRAKTGETEEFNGNRRADSYQGGSRSPPYEENSDRHQDRPSLGGRSPGYDQDNRQQNDYKRSPARAEVVNDWRREDRFGNGRKSEDRNSDGGSKLEGRSPDSQRDPDMSSPPIVRPVRDILGENVSPLRVIEPPKATGGKSKDGSTHTQRNASSSSLASSDGNPSAIKVEASFIDFDSVPEPPVTATVPQTQAATNSSAVQLIASSGNDWANFDSVPQVKAYTPVSNSVESVLSELSIAVSISGPSAPVDKVSPFHSSGSEGSAFGSIFESVAPSSVFPPGGAPAASPPAPQLSTVGTMLANTQNSIFPGTSGLPVPQPVTTIGGPSNNRPWNPLVDSNIHGPTGAATAQGGQVMTNPALDTTFGLSTESSLYPKSGGRKELPADLFTMTNSYLPPPVPGWYSGSPYAAGVPMHYNMQMAIPNYQPVSRSTNPFEFSNERSHVQAPTFPSVASLHGSLPKIASAPGLLHTSSLGTPSSLPLSMLAQPLSHASAMPPSSLLGQELAGSLAPRPLGLSGFGLQEPAFVSLNPNHQVRGLHSAHSAPSNFTSTGGNPFG